LDFVQPYNVFEIPAHNHVHFANLKTRSQECERAAIEDMGDHRRFNILMAEKYLDCSYVMTALKQVSGEGMAVYL
jgi:hypothetical protein